MEEWIIRLVQSKIAWTKIFEALRETWSSFSPLLGKVTLVIAGGSLGALCRYGTALLAARLIGTRFPWGTLLVNLTGCFLIGVSFALVDRINLLGSSARLFVMTGFLGALTTFSTFALETVNDLHEGDGLTGLVNLVVNNVAGLGLVFFGMWLVP